MRRWDTYRAAIAKGDKGSLPRDWFESVVDFADEERREAADALEQQQANIEADQVGIERLNIEIRRRNDRMGR